MVALASVAVGLLGASSASAVLPDGRVFEQVSPPDKRGADVIPNTSRVRVSADGDRVLLSSLTAFGDAQGIGVASEYLASRDGDGSGGWSSRGISPLQDSTGYFGGVFGLLQPMFYAFSSDLSSGVLLSRPPLTDAPNVETAANLYRRGDLLGADAASYELLTDSPTVQPPSRHENIDPSFGLWRPAVGDATPDLSQVLVESRRNLTADATACTEPEFPDNTCMPLLYEYADGGLRLVGYVPATPGAASCTGTGPDCVPASGSQAGRGATNLAVTERTLSRDGSRTVFTVPTGPLARSGALYVRDDHATADADDDTTVQVNASEKATPDAAQPAEFWAASTGVDDNGERVPLRVFFTGAEQLTDDDDNPVPDAYMWSEQPDGSGNHLTRLSVDNEPGDGSGNAVEGFLGTSEDGSYAYFAMTGGQLVAGGPTGATGGPVGGVRIYVWHDGTLREVSAANTTSELESLLGLNSATEKSTRVSPDGTHLVFLTEGTAESMTLYGRPEPDHGLTPDCRSGFSDLCYEVYVYDATADGGLGDLRCASCDPTGAIATGDASLNTGTAEGLGAAADTVYQNRVLSDDGRFVFFNTPERLQPGDRDDAIDAYEYDTSTRQVHLISEGDGNSNSAFMDASADGRDVFFTTRDRLRSTDTDQGRDLYVARIGGTPDPGVSVQTPCSGDGCQGGASDKPTGVAPLSTRTFDLGGRAVPRNCFSLTRRASRLSGQARRLRKTARRASDSRAVRLRRRAGRLDRQARRLKVDARVCSRAARRAAR